MIILWIYLVGLIFFLILGGYKQERPEDVLSIAVLWPVGFCVMVLYVPYWVGKKLAAEKLFGRGR